MWTLIHEMQPTRKAPKLANSADTIRLMRERDGKTDEQIRELFQLCHDDDFERTNVLSPDKLRRRWDDLELKLQVAPQNNGVAGEFAAVRATVLRIYSPDLRNFAEVESQLTPEQFRAVKLIGIDQVANGRGDSKPLAAEYAAARRAGK